MLRAWVIILLVLSSSARADSWPQFRGGSKVVENKSLPSTWDTKKNVVWNVDVAGRGWSSPIVWEDRIYLTSVIGEPAAQNPQKGLYINDLQGKTPKGEQRWMVLCLDFKSGKTLWEREVHKGKAPSSIHIKNTYASATAVTDGEHVVAYFGNVGVYCLSKDGNLVWEHKIPPTKTQMGWGPAASPALYKDRVFLVNDNDDKSYMQALELKSGKELWKIERKETSNWATPFVWDNGQRVEVVTAGKGRVRSYDLDGKLLWELGGMSVIAIPTPFAHNGLLYVTSGYVIDKSRPIYAIKPGAKGDITLKDKETSNDFIAWSHKIGGPYHPTPIAYGDYLYVLLDRGMLSCYEAKTGKLMYDRKRLEGGSAFTASPWAYDGKIFCLSEDGDTFVVKAGPEFELVGKNRLDDMAMATPAAVNGSLLIRTMGKLYRLEQKP